MSIAKALGGAEKVADSVRLFMVPGMAHCAGGDGTGAFGGVTVLEQWVGRRRRWRGVQTKTRERMFAGLRKMPAATYSPTQFPMQYHRRYQA